MTTFKTELKLGEKYRDTATGFVGTCTNITFYQHGCERLTLKGMDNDGRLVEYAFDAPEVEHVDTSVPLQVVERKTGGPHGLQGVTRR